MAKYTVVLKELLASPDIKEKIDHALSTYPLYEKRTFGEHVPVYIPTREELNAKILNFYKYREIGFETVGRFIEELEVTMMEIMPYYNQLFFSVDQDYDILHNVDYIREISNLKEGNLSSKVNESGTTTTDSTNTTETTDTSTTSANIDAHNKHVESDTPQGVLDVGTKGINDVNYASKVTWNNDNNTDNGTTSGESSATSSNNSIDTRANEITSTGENIERETHTEITKGNYGQVSYQSLLAHYRELIINVEQRIINDRRLAELFMQVY